VMATTSIVSLSLLVTLIVKAVRDKPAVKAPEPPVPPPQVPLPVPSPAP
jgi:hypothetical protein